MSVTTKLKQAELLSKVKLYILKELSILDEILNQSMLAGTDLVTDVSRHIISSGGKRIRPVLTIICSKMLGYNSSENHHINLAAAVELIHTATLLHDDVVDDGEIRRGNITAHNKWGEKASILVGDFLFSQAFKLMSLTSSPRTLSILSGAAVKIAEGEVKQLVRSTNINLSIEEYLDVISGKTAELFGAATAVAATICGKSEFEEKKLKEFGFNLGIIFQIIDDEIDYFGNSIIAGKNIGADFFAGKVTLPLIMLLSEDNNLKTLLEIRNQNNFEHILEAMKKYDIKEKVKDFVEFFYIKSLESLDLFPDNEAKELLSQILFLAKERNY